MTGARATAWESTDGEKKGACPTFAKQSAYADSNVDGNFTIRIRSDYDNFVMTYCKDNYVARKEGSNKNDADRTRISPDPVLLCSRDGAESDGYAEASAKNINRDLKSNATYLANADAAAFKSTVETLPAPERRLLTPYVKAPRPFGKSGASGITGEKGLPVTAAAKQRFEGETRMDRARADALQQQVKRSGVAIATTLVIRDLRANLIYLSQTLKYFDRAITAYPSLSEYFGTFEH